MYYIFGLGNPGLKYKNTRHNAGFLVIDELCKRHDVKLKASKFDALMGNGFIGTQKVAFIKPQTFMNNSGYAVDGILNYFEVPLNKAIVIYDDIDIPFGNLRIKEKGSAGTHNGMRSIMGYTKDGGFIRLRVGIGKAPHSLTGHVLGKFEDKEDAKKLIEKTADACECLITLGIAEAQNKYNISETEVK